MIIIHEGKIVAEDSIGNLSSMIGGASRIRLEVEGPADKVTECLQRIEGILKVHFQSPHHILECSGEHDPRAKIMEAIVQDGWTLLSLESIEMSLEDIFLKLTTEEESEE